MVYHTIKSLYYKDLESYQTERSRRLQDPNLVPLPLPIHSNPSFFVPTLDSLSLIDRIHLKLARLLHAYQQLPEAAQAEYFRSCLLDEIKFTNDIEGIQSTRHEIQAAYEQVTKTGSSDAAIRFSGIVNKYNKLVRNETIPLACAQNLRDLYDEIILPEIGKEDIPDGTIFRNGPVNVISPTQRQLHRGISGEKNIIVAVEKALTLLTMEEIPGLIRIAVLHYYLGYIHPFYDGNGRISRFISSYLLSKTIDPLIAYRLSYIIKSNRSRYYKAFDECNDVRNAGDITPFILSFLAIIEDAIDDILDIVTNGIEQLQFYDSIIDTIEDPNYIRDILFLLVQNRLFSPTPFSAKDLAALLSKSTVTITNKMKQLITEGYPIKKERIGQKFVYSIDLDALKQWCDVNVKPSTP